MAFLLALPCGRNDLASPYRWGGDCVGHDNYSLRVHICFHNIAIFACCRNMEWYGDIDD